MMPRRPESAESAARPAARHTTRFPAPGQGLAYLLFRTTPRDRWLLAMLAEHRVLTIAQAHALCFASERRATARLRELYQLALTDRFRTNPLPGTGSSALRYVLGPAGALLVAASHDMTPKQFRYDHAKLLRQAARADLPHTLACNSVMIGLALAAAAAGTPIQAWWEQNSCLPMWGDLIRPDAYATLGHNTAGVEAGTGLFLEYDTGSEHLPQLTAKIDGYARFAETYNASHLILIHVPDPARELALHARLSQDPRAAHLPIATAHGPVEDTDARLIRHLGARVYGPAWRPLGVDARTALTDLPAHFRARDIRLLPPIYTDRAVTAPAPNPPLPSS